MGDAEPRRGPSRGGLKEAKELKDLQEMFTAARLGTCLTNGGPIYR
jgi:hypothetical protein